ncbi:MAG: hypothetical protein AABY93_07445 [Bacteroidota bacterium]
MVDYSVKVDSFEEELPEMSPVGEGFGINPFPGLRPFSIEECHLFFGREGQVDEILMKLSQNHTITIMGYSGSGKSSLLYCGLVPVLYGGFMTHTSPHWQVITTRPGNAPIANLTNAITDLLIKEGQIDEKDKSIYRSIIGAVLRSGPDGLIEVSKFIQTKAGENVFISLDQFEELFRYKASQGEDFSNEAAAYVNLILTAVNQKVVPIYIAINMRSDFIGDCSAFPGLTQMINTSNYLVPQMTREQKRMAIEGPVAVGDGRISQRLVKKLLSDIGDNQDQLPIMQHALMRTWDYWKANHEEGEPMDVRHYNAIGKITQALSLHANEAYDELSSREKEIAEILFKNTTEKNQDNQEMRRPVKISVVAEIAEASEREVVNVVDHFRKSGRSLLMPGPQVPLQAGSNIELSHESMMRIWNRLSGWVDEEHESAGMYRRISEAAAMYQIGKTGLWRPPDLQLALNWQKKQKPTRTWAQRYDIAFERAIVFLDTSRITYEAELKNQEMLQRRRLRRARITSLILGSAFIIALFFFFYGLTQQIKAEQQAIIAKEETAKALLAKKDADDQKEIAQKATLTAIEKQNSLTKALDNLQKALAETKIAKDEAERQFLEAKRQEEIAINAQGKESLARLEAERQTEIARENFDRANRLLYLSVAQSLEAKAETMDDQELAGLLSMQGYLFHTKYEGRKYDPYVFRGLYSALTKLSGLNYNAVKVPGGLKNKMFAVAVSKSGSTFYTTGNDGFIVKGDYATLATDKENIGSNPFPNRVLALSKDEEYLINGSDSSYIQIYNLITRDKPLKVIGHKGFVNDIKFLPDDSGFISASSDKTLRLTNHKTGLSKLLMTVPYNLKSIDISSDGKSIVGASPSGELIHIDLSNNNTITVLAREAPNRILSVAFHPTKQLIAYGTELLNEKGVPFKGTVKLYDLVFQKQMKELGGHKAGVSDIQFSPDGLLLASAGLDKRLQMWVVDHEEDLPILMDNNNGQVWDLAFSAGSDFLLTSCNNGEIRVWPTDPKMLAEEVCPKLPRNMTQEEWGIYIANGIPYENTCKSLLIKDL